jgi:hypothetical protein
VADSIELYVERLLERPQGCIGREAAEEHVKEIRSHLQMSAADLIAQGMPEGEAVATALRQLGSDRRVAGSLVRAHFQGNRLQRAGQLLLGVFACALASFIVTIGAWVAMGGKPDVLALWSYWVVMVGFQSAWGGLGLLFRRPALVGIVLGAGFGLFHLWAALHGTGPWIGWARNIFAVTAEPTLNGILLSRCLKMIERRGLSEARK